MVPPWQAALALVLLSPLLYQGVCALCQSLSSNQLSAVIRISFSLAVPFVLVYLYSQEVVKVFFELKNSISTFQREQDKNVEQNVLLIKEMSRDK